MKYNLFFIVAFCLAAVSSCSNEHIAVNAKQCKSIDVLYSFSSSLDETQSYYKGNLTYRSDSSIQYTLLVNDSILFYNYNYRHGILNLPHKLLHENNPIDENGLPQGTFASDLIPLFIGDSTYLEDIQSDTIDKKTRIDIIGEVILIEQYSDKPYAVDSLITFINSRSFTCFNKSNKQIYFEFSISCFTIGGFPFTQKDLKNYSYPKLTECSLENYEEAIKHGVKVTSAKENKNNSLKIIPDFHYSDLDYTIFQSKNIKESYVLLEFWYLSCAPCIKNMKNLNQLYAKYQKNVKFLVLNDHDNYPEKIKKFRDKYHLRYDLYFKGNELMKTLNISAHPHTIIYESQTSNIVYQSKGTGSLYIQEISSVLDSVLNKNKLR